MLHYVLHDILMQGMRFIHPYLDSIIFTGANLTLFNYIVMRWFS